jgi:hypothetical protein
VKGKEDMPNKIIPQEHRDAMVAAYLAGATAEAAASQFGYSYMACIFALKQRGIKPRGRSEARRVYAVDESFFDVINTEEKAYWLGFLTADGTIGDDLVMLALQEGDIPHLYKFTSSLRSNHPIIHREQTQKDKVYRFGQVCLTSQRLARALHRLGVGKKKSFIVRPCEQVPEHLLSHYWRGVFDGDGFVTRARGRMFGAIKWDVGLVGNRAIVLGFETFIRQCTGQKAQIKPHSRIFTVRYSGVALPQAILQVLYYDATIFLERKYLLVYDVMSTPVQRRKK